MKLMKTPIEYILAEMAGVTPEEIKKWTKEDWLKFADELEDSVKKEKKS